MLQIHWFNVGGYNDSQHIAWQIISHWPEHIFFFLWPPVLSSLRTDQDPLTELNFLQFFYLEVFIYILYIHLVVTSSYPPDKRIPSHVVNLIASTLQTQKTFFIYLKNVYTWFKKTGRMTNHRRFFTLNLNGVHFVEKTSCIDVYDRRCLDGK